MFFDARELFAFRVERLKEKKGTWDTGRREWKSFFFKKKKKQRQAEKNDSNGERMRRSKERRSVSVDERSQGLHGYLLFLPMKDASLKRKKAFVVQSLFILFLFVTWLT